MSGSAAPQLLLVSDAGVLALRFAVVSPYTLAAGAHPPRVSLAAAVADTRTARALPAALSAATALAHTGAGTGSGAPTPAAASAEAADMAFALASVAPGTPGHRLQSAYAAFSAAYGTPLSAPAALAAYADARAAAACGATTLLASPVQHNALAPWASLLNHLPAAVAVPGVLPGAALAPFAVAATAATAGVAPGAADVFHSVLASASAHPVSSKAAKGSKGSFKGSKYGLMNDMDDDDDYNNNDNDDDEDSGLAAGDGEYYTGRAPSVAAALCRDPPAAAHGVSHLDVLVCALSLRLVTDETYTMTATGAGAGAAARRRRPQTAEVIGNASEGVGVAQSLHARACAHLDLLRLLRSPSLQARVFDPLSPSVGASSSGSGAGASSAGEALDLCSVWSLLSPLARHTVSEHGIALAALDALHATVTTLTSASRSAGHSASSHAAYSNGDDDSASAAAAAASAVQERRVLLVGAMAAAVAAVPAVAAAAEAAVATHGATTAGVFFANPTLLPLFIAALAARAHAAADAVPAFRALVLPPLAGVDNNNNSSSSSSGAVGGAGSAAEGSAAEAVTDALVAALAPVPAAATATAAAAAAVASAAACVATAAAAVSSVAAAITAHAAAVSALFLETQRALGFAPTLAPAVAYAGAGGDASLSTQAGELAVPVPLLLTHGVRLAMITLATHTLRALRVALAPHSSGAGGSVVSESVVSALRNALAVAPRTLITEYAGYNALAAALATTSIGASASASASSSTGALRREQGAVLSLLLTVTHAAVLLHQRNALALSSAQSNSLSQLQSKGKLAPASAAASAAGAAASAAAFFSPARSFALAAAAGDAGSLIALVEHAVGQALLAARSVVAADAATVGATLAAVAAERLEPLLATYGAPFARALVEAYTAVPAATVARFNVHPAAPAAVALPEIAAVSRAAAGAAAVAAAAYTGLEREITASSSSASAALTAHGHSVLSVGGRGGAAVAAAAVRIVASRGALRARLLRVFPASSYAPRVVREVMPPNYCLALPQCAHVLAPLALDAGADDDGEDSDNCSGSTAVVLFNSPGPNSSATKGKGSKRSSAVMLSNAATASAVSRSVRWGAPPRALLPSAAGAVAPAFHALVEAALTRSAASAPTGSATGTGVASSATGIEGSALALLWQQQVINARQSTRAIAATGTSATALAPASLFTGAGSITGGASTGAGTVGERAHWAALAKLSRLAAATPMSDDGTGSDNNGPAAAAADSGLSSASSAAVAAADLTLFTLQLQHKMALTGYPVPSASASASASAYAAAVTSTGDVLAAGEDSPALPPLALARSCLLAARAAAGFGEQGYDALRLAVWRALLAVAAHTALALALAPSPAASAESAAAAAAAACEGAVRDAVSLAVAADAAAWRALAADRRGSALGGGWTVAEAAATAGVTELFLFQLAAALAALAKAAAAVSGNHGDGSPSLGAAFPFSCYDGLRTDCLGAVAGSAAVAAVAGAVQAAVAALSPGSPAAATELPTEVKPLAKTVWSAGWAHVKPLTEEEVDDAQE